MSFTERIGDFKKIAINSMRNSLVSMNLPKKQRKIVEKNIFRKGRMTNEALIYLKKNREGLLDSLSREFPLTEKFCKNDLILEYFCEKISNAELLDEIQSGFFDPENFIGWYIDLYKKGLSIPAWLRDAGQNNSAKIKALRDKYEELMDIGIKAGKSEKEVYNDIKLIGKRLQSSAKFQRTKILKSIWKKREYKFKKYGLTEKIWEEKIINSALGEIPSIDIYEQALLKYVICNVSNLKYKRKILSSDHPDLLHACYLPYVDIFRADGNMANLLKPLGKLYNTQVFSSLADIIGVIDKL